MKILFENMDTDNDGIVDFAEFLAALEGERRMTHLTHLYPVYLAHEFFHIRRVTS